MQNTNSAAFLSTKPVRTPNFGSLVEEHIRYWERYKDQKEARELANQARANEFNRRLAGDNRKRLKSITTRYEGLSDIDADGYFREQIVKYKKHNSDKWLDLARRADDGDQDAIIQLGAEKEKLNNLVNASTTIQGKLKGLSEQQQKEGINQFRDKDLVKLIDTFATSRYVLDEQLGKFRIYDEDGQKVLLEVDPLKLTNEFLQSNFNKPPTFRDNAVKIAKNVLDTVGVDKTTSSQTKPRAVQRINTYFADNGNDAISWYLKEKDNLGIKKDFSELNADDKQRLSEKFYDEVVSAEIANKTQDPILRAKQLQQLRNAQLEGASKSLTIKKKEKGLSDDVGFKLITDSSGKPVSQDSDIINGNLVEGSGFSIALEKPIKLGDNVYDSATITGSNVEFIGVTKADLDEEGNIVKLKGSINTTTKDKTNVGRIIGQLKGVSSTKDLVDKANKLKGDDAESVDKKTETLEERRKRLNLP